MVDVPNRPETQSERFNLGPSVRREAPGGDRVDASPAVKG
jgi:hypothetical protein